MYNIIRNTCDNSLIQNSMHICHLYQALSLTLGLQREADLGGALGLQVGEICDLVELRARCSPYANLLGHLLSRQRAGDQCECDNTVSAPRNPHLLEKIDTE